MAQEVFLQIYISLPEYKADNFKAWVSSIASNKSRDWIRKKKSKFREETMEKSEYLIDVVNIKNDGFSIFIVTVILIFNMFIYGLMETGVMDLIKLKVSQEIYYERYIR